MLKFFFADKSNFSTQKRNALCTIINRVYEETEGEFLVPGKQRITLEALNDIIAKKELLVVELDPENEVVGCVHLTLVDKETAMFGMLVSHPEYQGKGIGKQLVSAAENWALEQGCSKMCLELLSPKNYSTPHKNFLKAWYMRLGYVPKADIPYHHEDLLVVVCDFKLYCKELKPHGANR